MSEQLDCDALQEQNQEEYAQQDQQYAEEQPQEDYYIDQQYDDLSLHASLSKDQPYNICHLDQLLKKIREQINSKAALCCMSQGWTLLLYSFTNFNPYYFNDLLDQDNTGRNIIKYDQTYAPGVKLGECAVCLMQTQLISNPCGHSFCLSCWSYHLQLSLTDRNIYELFPLCPQEQCYHRVNYHLMALLWQNSQPLLTSFEKLLCLKYSQNNYNVRICPNEACGKAIYINSVDQPSVQCECGTDVCRHCGAEGHWPLHCSDLRNWNSMVSGTEDQWINSLVTQKCPMCRETIEKNNGCIHMTCRCKYQFCWICLKVWKGHSGYYACSEVSRDDHQKKLKEEQVKRSQDEGLYSQRLEQARGETERLTHCIKRITNTSLDGLVNKLMSIHVLSIQSDTLKAMQSFIKKAWGLVYRCTICNFFQREDSLCLRRVVFRINKLANNMDDFLTQTLEKKFKELQERIQKRVKNNEGGEKEISQTQRLNMRFYFQKEEKLYSFKVREGLKVIDMVRRGEISNALAEVINPNSPLFVEKEPLELIQTKKETKVEEDESIEQMDMGMAMQMEVENV